MGLWRRPVLLPSFKGACLAVLHMSHKGPQSGMGNITIKNHIRSRASHFCKTGAFNHPHKSLLAFTQPESFKGIRISELPKKIRRSKICYECFQISENFVKIMWSFSNALYEKKKTEVIKNTHILKDN